MEQLTELILNLRKDIADLRSDMHVLSQKVDRLTPHVQESREVYVTENVATQDVSQGTANYGCVLSASEQAYLDQLHHKTVRMQPVVAQQSPTIAPQAPSPHATPQYTPAGPNIVERFFAWLAKDWPMKVGGFFVIAAVGWFVTYAAKEGWLSEAARVVLGYGFSVACIMFGALRADRERAQGNVFLVIGSAAMLISTLAGIYYDLIVHGVGLFVMLASVGCVTLISLKQKSVALTSSMIFFGAIIPLFFFSGVSINTIFVYLFILTLGTVWVVSFTQWRGLTLLMLSVVAFYSLGYLVDAYGEDLETVTNIIVAFSFIATFYFANVVAVNRSSKPHVVDLLTAIGTGLLFLVWMISFAPDSLEVFLLLIGTMFFAVASYVIYDRTNQKSPTVIYGGVSTMLFAVATALQFDGSVLVTAYAVEAAAIAIVVMYFAREELTNGVRLLLTTIYSIPVFMSLYYVAEIFSDLQYLTDGVVEKMPGLFAIFVICITAFAIAIAAVRLTGVRNEGNMTFFRIFAYTGGFYALVLIWFVTHLFMQGYDVATFVSLVIYTVVGVFFYIMGMRENYKPYMAVGGVLFGLVVARVLFVEFWEMNIVMRIITSFVLGALLISTAFIRPIKK